MSRTSNVSWQCGLIDDYDDFQRVLHVYFGKMIRQIPGQITPLTYGPGEYHVYSPGA